MQSPSAEQRRRDASTLLAGRFVCPACGAKLPSIDRQVAVVTCPVCSASYRRGSHWLDLTPPPAAQSPSPLWDAWRQLQANGLVSYNADPIRNLSVGDREDCRAFARFCGFQGLVLDVGCGPQRWPAYFGDANDAAFVGIDPLADQGPADFLKFVGLAEHLPFAGETFQHVLFSTTIDHFVDPERALREAARVAGASGEIDLWLGEKDAAAPAPTQSPEWYAALQRPAAADDVFHIERMDADRFRALASRADLRIVEEERHQIDPHRRHWFFRLRCR